MPDRRDHRQHCCPGCRCGDSAPQRTDDDEPMPTGQALLDKYFDPTLLSQTERA